MGNIWYCGLCSYRWVDTRYANMDMFQRPNIPCPKCKSHDTWEEM